MVTNLPTIYLTESFCLSVTVPTLHLFDLISINKYSANINHCITFILYPSIGHWERVNTVAWLPEGCVARRSFSMCTPAEQLLPELLWKTAAINALLFYARIPARRVPLKSVSSETLRGALSLAMKRAYSAPTRWQLQGDEKVKASIHTKANGGQKTTVGFLFDFKYMTRNIGVRI